MGPQLYRCGNELKDNYIVELEEELQWGRNFIVVEIHEPRRPEQMERAASMEPQLYRCGNRRSGACNVAHASTGFNGATTLSLRKFSN